MPQHGMPMQHHTMTPGYGGPIMPGQYPMSRGSVHSSRPPTNQVYHPGQPYPPSPHGYNNQHHTTAGTWEPPAPAPPAAPFPGAAATGVQSSPAVPSSAVSQQECNVSEGGGSGETATGTNGQATARPPPSSSASSAGSRSMSPAIASPNIPPMPPRPATSHTDPSGVPRVPQPHSVYPQPGVTSAPHKMAAAPAGGYPMAHGGLHPSYPAMYARPPHYPGQYQPAPGYTVPPGAGPQAPITANWPASKQPAMYPAPPSSPQYMRHQLQPVTQKAGLASNGVAPPAMAPPPSSTPQPTRPASQCSDPASIESTGPPTLATPGSTYPLLPPIGPDGVPLDDASQHSTLSNTSITSEDRSRSPKPRKDISGNSSSLPPTPVAGVALSPGGQQQQQQPTPQHQQLSEDSEHTNMSSPTTSWPRSPVSVYNPSAPRDNYHVKKADSLNRLYDIDDNPMRREFLNRLLVFMEDRGTPILQCPTVSKQPLDLFRLYHHTKERGGFVEVMKNKAWKDVAIAMGIGGSSSGAYTLRKHYMKNLIFYECHFDGGGIDPAPILSKYETKSAKKKNAPSPGPQDSFSNSGSMDGFPAGYGPNYGTGVSSTATASAEYNNSNSNSNNGPNQPAQGYPPHGYPGPQSGYGHYPNTPGAEYAPVQGQAPPPGHYMHQYPGRGPYHHAQQQTPPSQPPSVDYRYGSGPAPGAYGGPTPRHPYPTAAPPPPGVTPAATAPPNPSVSAPAGDTQQPPTVTSAPSQFQMPSSSVNFSSQLAKQLSAPLPSRANVQTSPSKNQQSSAFMPAPTLAKQLAAPSFSQLKNNATFSNANTGAAPGTAVTNTSAVSAGSYGSSSTTVPPRRPEPAPGAPSPSLAPPAAGTPSAHHSAPVSYAQTPPYGWRGYHPSQQYGSTSPWAHSNSPAAPRFPNPAPYPPPPQQQPTSGSGWPQAQNPVGLAAAPRQTTPLRPPIVGKDRALQSGVVKTVGGGAAANTAVTATATSRSITFPADSVEAVAPLLAKRRRLARADVCPVDGWRLVMSLRSGQLAESSAALDQLLVLSHDDSTVAWLALTHMPGLLPALVQHWRHSLALVLGSGSALDPCGGDTAPFTADSAVCKMEVGGGDGDGSGAGLGVCQPFDPSDKCTLLTSTDYTLNTRQNRPVVVQDKHDAILVSDQAQQMYLNDYSPSADWTHLVSGVRVESGRVPIVRRLRDGRVTNAEGVSSSQCNETPAAKSQPQPPPPASLPNFDTDLEFFLSRLRPELPPQSPPSSSAPCDSVGFAVKQEPGSTADGESEGSVSGRVRDPAGVLRRRREDDLLEDECCRREQSALTLIADTQLAAMQRCVALTTLLRNLSFVPGNELELAVEPILAPLAELVLLRHRHPARSARHHNYDRDEEADFAVSNNNNNSSGSGGGSGGVASTQADDCWWLEFVPLLHEHALVTLSNVCGHVRLAEHEETLVWPLFDGLLHWLVCSSSYAGDPLPCGASSSGRLSPRRLALECVCRLCVCADNVDLLLATPPLHRLQRLCRLAAGWLAAAGDDHVLRELTLSLVYYLSDADERVARWLAVEPGFIAALVRFVETAEHNALTVANTQGVHALRDNPELMGTSLDMLGRAASTLLHLARVDDNRQLLVACEHRLLQLVMSQILDQRVAATLAHVLHRVARPASPHARHSCHLQQQQQSSS